MSNQLLKDSTALRMFFTEPVYITGNPSVNSVADEAAVPEKKTAAQEEIIIDEPAPVAYQFIGKNKRNILILVNDPANDISNTAGTELLRNIVKHLKFDKDDFALLNHAKYPDATFKSLKTFFNSNSIIAFGILPQQLGLPDNTVTNRVEENTRIVLASALHEMADNLDAKKAFWSILKTIEEW